MEMMNKELTTSANEWTANLSAQKIIEKHNRYLPISVTKSEPRIGWIVIGELATLTFFFLAVVFGLAMLQ